MDENLRFSTAQKSAKLGDIAALVLQERISPQQEKFSRISAALDNLLPAELKEHYRLADFTGGQLKIAADSPAYVYELQLCSSELVKQLQQQCPASRISKIKVMLG